MAQSITSGTIGCPPDTLREYLGATANLPTISDPELSLEVLSAPEVVAEGELIEFRISAYGFKQRMTHKYVSVGAMEIVAEQTDGPTRSWIHKQTIEANSDGTSTLTDQIDFEPPGGMLGYVMTEDNIIGSIEEGMQFRYETLQKLLGT